MDKLRENHPQKFFLKNICRVLYYFGTCDCWYEDAGRSELWKRFYPIWRVISNGYVFLNSFNELAAFLRTDLSDRERKDLSLLSFAHLLICVKLLVMYGQQDRIRVLLKRLLEDNRSIFPDKELEKQSVRKAMKYCSSLCVAVYGTLTLSLLAAIRDHFKDGRPLKNVVTYYPSPNSSGYLIVIIRVLIEFHWWYSVTIMVFIECLCLFCLAFLSFKFRRTRLFFESLREKFLYCEGNLIMNDEYRKDFVLGIQLHENALRCARSVQYALGNIYSVQIIQSIILTVNCMLSLVSVKHSLPFLFANLTFMSGLVILTGCYMLDSGDVTYEASLIPTAIFHSGWELTRRPANLRTLVVTALQRSQVPVCMTAFGIIILSSSNFISVLRSSYSFFAVMY